MIVLETISNLFFLIAGTTTPTRQSMAETPRPREIVTDRQVHAS